MSPTILITGASQGIGKATAFLFAQHGYNLVLAARQRDRLEAVAQELKVFTDSVLAIPTDVRDIQQVETLVQTALEQFGSIDILVNNAGLYLSGSVDSFSLADWHQAIDTNLWGYIHMIYTVLPHFINRESGTIVNICSIGGKIPIPYLVPYVTSKYAVSGLTQALQSELAPKGIQVCGIYPNLIKSNLMERAIFKGNTEQEAQARREQVEKILQLSLIEKPEDVAEAIWQAIQKHKAEVMVGSATLSQIVYRFFPKPMQGLFQKVFKHETQV